MRAGQKKKIKIKVSKIKKIKVKSSKKSIATVKKVGKKSIRITGKKAGKAVITLKITTTKKKVKTFKYKVTVKKKKVEQNNSKNNQTEEQSSETLTDISQIKSQYSYELKIMNSQDKNLYNNSKVVIYVKTNNPNTSTIKADCGTSRLVKMEDESGAFYTEVDEFTEVISPKAYDDVNYTDDNNAVNGGYLFIYKWDTPGKKKFTIQEKVGEEWVVAAKMEIELNDRDKAEDEWLQSVIEAVTDSTMTDSDKMYKLRQYVLDNFKYDRNNEQ